MVQRYDFVPVDECNMCGSTSFAVMGLRLNRSQGRSPKLAEGIAVSVKKCRACGLVFSDPRPIPASMSDHYGLPSDEYWTSDAHQWTPDYFAPEIEEAKRLLSFTPGMQALDIGVGLGKAMKSLEVSGFDVWGCEPIPQFRDRAIALHGLRSDRIQFASVEEADFPENNFDFITFGAVLEHIHDPKSALLRSMKWLRPGGVMQIEVPSSDWLISKLVNAYFWLRGTNFVTNISPMHSPFHLYEFTLGSFKDFEVASHRYSVCSIPHVPRFVRPILRQYMHTTKRGMQLTVFLRRS